VFGRSGRPQPGKALETAVLVELLRREAELGYVRTAEGFEVDFLARFPGREDQLIQVCSQLDDPATRDREVRGLIAAATEHPQAQLILLTLTPESARDVPPPVRVVDAAVWFLGSGRET